MVLNVGGGCLNLVERGKWIILESMRGFEESLGGLRGAESLLCPGDQGQSGEN